MGSATHTVCVLLCFWVLGSCYKLPTVGPCVVNRETAAFDCSGKHLKSIPQHIWMNVTELNLSDNLLDLTQVESLKRLNRFSHLVTLNLSGNYLPLLLKDHLYSLPSLKVLDLSRCKLDAVDADALSSLSRLQMFYLGNIQATVIQEMRLKQFEELRGEPNDKTQVRLIRESKQRTNSYDEQSKDTPSTAELTTIEPTTSITSKTSSGTEENGQKSSSGSWKVLVSVLASAITLSVIIAVMAKCKVVHKYLASYRHSRLSEVDTTSQCDPANLEVGFSTHGGPGTRAAAPTNDTEDDDDGFIEDNYIQASESERAARAAALAEDDEEEEEIEFSIG